MEILFEEDIDKDTISSYIYSVAISPIIAHIIEKYVVCMKHRILSN